MRITASLIDPSQNASLWSNSFDRDRRNVMELQRDVALAIAEAIKVALTPQDKSRLAKTDAVVPEAFELYIKGTQARYDANFTGDFSEATRHYSRAIALDSGYAPAYAGLATVYAFVSDSVRARALARKALTLDPNLAEAHVADGVIRMFYDWNWSAAEEAFRQAIALNPGYAEAHHELSMLLSRLRRFRESLEEGRLASYLSPMSVRFLEGIAEVQAYSGQLDEALAIADRILADDSTTSGGYAVRGLVYEQKGRYDLAVNAWVTCLRVAGCDYAHARLGYLYGVTGRREQAKVVVDSLKTRLRQGSGRAGSRGRIALDIANVYIGLGDKAEALNWMERAAEDHAFMLYLAIDPIYKPLYPEPRFQALLKRIGLVR